MLIPARYNGPTGSGSGNGGYACGLLAQLLGGSPATGSGTGFPTAEVTLRTPPPLDTPLSVRREAAGPLAGAAAQRIIRVYAGAALVAEALPVEPVTAAVPPASLAEAAQAARSYPGFTDHPFPACYVCGPQRPRGDGLRVFPGRLPDGRTAAPFTVPSDVTAATVWAALDCPGGWAVISAGRPYVLGRMAATLARLPHPGEVCVVVGRCDEAQGRKAAVTTSLYGPDGDLLATACATWIAVEVGVNRTGG